MVGDIGDEALGSIRLRLRNSGGASLTILGYSQYAPKGACWAKIEYLALSVQQITEIRDEVANNQMRHPGGI